MCKKGWTISEMSGSFICRVLSRPAERPHWHIDYLRPHTILEEIWFCYGRKTREHDWARCFSGMRGVGAAGWVRVVGLRLRDAHVLLQEASSGRKI